MKTDTKHTDDILVLQGCIYSARWYADPDQWIIAHKTVDRVAESHAALLAALEGIVKDGGWEFVSNARWAAARAAIHKARHGSLGAAGAATQPHSDSAAPSA